MGDNITCIVLITLPEIAFTNTLTLDSMTFADPSGNEVTVFST